MPLNPSKPVPTIQKLKRSELKQIKKIKDESSELTRVQKIINKNNSAIGIDSNNFAICGQVILDTFLLH